MPNDTCELETDEEIREYQHQKLGDIAFEAMEARLEAEKQLADLQVLLANSTRRLGLYRQRIILAKKYGHHADEVKFREYRQESQVLKKMIVKRIKQLERVRAELISVEEAFRTRGSDA